MAVAVFRQNDISGCAIACEYRAGTRLRAEFSVLPPGKHGFHIHTAGDLRGAGCAGACEHFHVGPPATHGDRPPQRRQTRKTIRHTGDLGNIALQKGRKKAIYNYYLPEIKPSDLWGRTLIIHADEDDLGTGPHEDSKTTGHSGARIGCAIFGRCTQCPQRTPRAATSRRRQRGGAALEVIYNNTNVGGSENNPTMYDLETMKIPPKITFPNLESNKFYTLIMYDPNAVSGTFLHMLTVNINKMQNGVTCVDYHPPTPPLNSGIHHYTFALYKQNSETTCDTYTRSMFDLNRYVTEHKLTLVANVVFTIDSSK